MILDVIRIRGEVALLVTTRRIELQNTPVYLDVVFRTICICPRVNTLDFIPYSGG